MEIIEKRLNIMYKALATLQESLTLLNDPQHTDVYTQMRDSVIQRFEYTIDMLWKVIRVHIENHYGVTFETISPRIVLQQAVTVGLLSHEEFEYSMTMIKDRNLTSHAYREDTAEAISDNIADYYIFIKNVVDRLQ